MSNDTDAGCVPCEVCGGSQDRGWHKHPMTLTDFLLARIAEDEAVVNDPDAEGCPHALGCEVNSYNSGDCDCTWPAQVLAECEAKRRILDLAATYAAVVSERRDGGTVMLSATLRFLALPYADHPDYNPDWRP